MDREEFFDHLILEGAVEPAGVDPTTGEIVYTFTDKLKEIDEDMYNKAIESFHQDVMLLWEHGFLNVTWLDEEPLVTVTPKVLDQDAIRELPLQLQQSLVELLRMMKR